MKNKFALCFRPVVMESEEISDRSTGTTAVSKDIMVAKVQKINGTILPPSMSPSLLKNSCGSGVQVPPFPQPQNHSRKALSRVLKTILFETPPVSFTTKTVLFQFVFLFLFCWLIMVLSSFFFWCRE